MDPRVPISTDNIYKFQATFGLVIIITCCVLFVLNGQYANRTIIDVAEKMSIRESSGEAISEDQKELYQIQIDVTAENREFYNKAIGVITALALIIAYLGFRKWSKETQPLHDQILRLEKEKLELEVAALKNQAVSDSPETGENSTAS